MVRATNNAARLVLQGISVLGILFGFICILGGTIGFFSIQREDFTSLWLVLSISVILLVVGAWLARDCYLMLRGRAFERTKAISGLLAFVLFGWVESLFVGVDDAFVDVKGFVGDIVFLATWLPSVVCAVLVYSISTRLLNKLVETAHGPQDRSGKQHSVDPP
jgi:4-amino-4-deoxy-L-arabinose transferase-like glycosyltransferase